MPRAPLPLDLHVLGLSLAFILSQDQTLRCCLSLFYFFSLSARAPPTGRRTGRGGAPGFPARTPVSGFQFICAPVLESTRTRRGTHPSSDPPSGGPPRLCHIVCSIISKVLFPPSATPAAGSAKVTTFSVTAKTFFAALAVGNRRSPFAVAKVLPKFPFHQIFRQLFSEKFCTI